MSSTGKGNRRTDDQPTWGKETDEPTFNGSWLPIGWGCSNQHVNLFELKLNSKNLSTTGFLFGQKSFFFFGKVLFPVDIINNNSVDGKSEERYRERRPYNRQSNPWGFLFWRPEKCVREDRSTWLTNSETLTETTYTEIRRWSSLSEDECQCFVSVEDGVLNCPDHSDQDSDSGRPFSTNFIKQQSSPHSPTHSLSRCLFCCQSRIFPVRVPRSSNRRVAFTVLRESDNRCHLL